MTNRTLAIIVKDQKPLTLAPDATVESACRAMWKAGAGSVLVADGAGKLLGIFTGRDAARLLADGTDPATTRLAEAMTPHPLTIRPTGRAIDALEAMRAGGFRHMPVTDEDRICGVISRGDLRGMELEQCVGASGGIYAAAVERTVGEIVAGQSPVVLDASVPIGEACRRMCDGGTGSVLVVGSDGALAGIFTGRDAMRAAAAGKPASTTPLADAMTRDPTTLPPGAAAIDALRLMSDLGFRHLPVVEGGRTLGIVSRRDFTGCEIDRLDEDERLKECIW